MTPSQPQSESRFVLINSNQSVEDDMRKAASKPENVDETATPFPNFGAAAFGEQMLPAYMQAGQALFTNAIAFNQEMMRFAAERMQADAQGLHEVMQCKNWQDAIACHSQFMDSATKAYQTEMTKLMEHASHATSDVMEPMRDAAKASPQDVPRT